MTELKVNRVAVRKVLDAVKADGRTSLTAPEGKLVADAYGIAVPGEGVAGSAAEAARLAQGMGYPVVMKIVSPDILHKTEAGGVVVGVASDDAAKAAYATILTNAKAYKADARIDGVQVQQMLKGGTEVIVGAITDKSFGKLVAFGLGGILVEVLKDITFRLAPATRDDAFSMLDGIKAREMLHGVRGGEAVNRDALADIIVRVSQLVSDFPEIVELDLNPVFATTQGAIAADVRIVVDFDHVPREAPRSNETIVTAMKRIMQPKAVAVIGASAEDGKIGNSVMKNLVNGGYRGEIYPVHPKAERDPRLHGVQIGQGHSGRGRCRGVCDSRQGRGRRLDRVRREEDPGRGADSLGLCRGQRAGTAGRDRRHRQDSTTSA